MLKVELDHCPFGLTFNSNRREGGIANRYQYNGKELQDALNLGWLDYGSRMYMNDIGRWGTIDPLSEIYHTDTAYGYVLNNPLSSIDPDGREVVGVTKDDAEKMQNDMNVVFVDAKFDAFRGLLTRTGKKRRWEEI
ncbi:RHS repeat-associated core domain-containing protein [Chryseolinea lacunae]|uniref:RHS repeat-associated core domain-containing protein n=1 Tax=Chryseolinea lacunae TaxID=2801331 RepID=A0ABS1L0D4_9BACT|nr:RHS repeat-associated core domain-containing protein [Chryseolinea lacunae]MBL0744972.1 hypothetical protein [Chryseolinea lacunae]